jgi:acetate kinase
VVLAENSHLMPLDYHLPHAWNTLRYGLRGPSHHCVVSTSKGIHRVPPG